MWPPWCDLSEVDKALFNQGNAWKIHIWELNLHWDLLLALLMAANQQADDYFTVPE